MRVSTRTALVIAALASALPAFAACPTPSNAPGAVIHAEKGPGYRWTFNSDGYPHLIVTDTRVKSTKQLQVSCTVMREAIQFGGKFAVVAIGNLGAPIAADVEVPSIKPMFLEDKDFKASVWQQQSAALQRSTLAGNVGAVLAQLIDNPWLDRGWEMKFVQKNGAGKMMTSSFQLGPKTSYSSRRDARVTFTGDFNQPASIIATFIENKLAQHDSNPM